MRIEHFWARGFRSLRDVRLEGLGPFNVLYGQNGSGKSNILAAIRALLELLRAQTCLHPPDTACDKGAQAVLGGKILQRRDLYLRHDARTVVLGARLVGADIVSGPIRVDELTIEIKVEWIVEASPSVFVTRLESGEQDLRTTLPREHAEFVVALLTEVIPAKAFTLVGADRFLAERDEPLPGEARPDLAWHIEGGGLARRLLRAHIDSRPAVRRRLDDLHALLEGPPLHRPPFFPVHDERTNRIELHERLPDPNPEGLEIPIDLAGLGVAQIYVILAQAMLSGARAVGVEEPEAHLHAPTSGLHLRKLLRRLVDERYIDQLFIATHSNLFDLDETGFWDVRLEEGETRVEKKPLDAIDQHLYEPGPTVHAFEELLKLSEPERVMYRRPGGAPVTSREILAMLRADEPEAVEYLRDVHRAAVDVVGLRARRKTAS